MKSVCQRQGSGVSFAWLAQRSYCGLITGKPWPPPVGEAASLPTAEERSSNSTLAININVGASDTITMPKYYKRIKHNPFSCDILMTSCVRIVLDTDAIVAAMRSPTGTSAGTVPKHVKGR